MGNESSSANEGELYNPTEFIMINSINDGRYGEIKVLKNKLTNLQVCEVNRTLSSEQAFEKHKERAFKRKELSNQNIVKLINFTAIRKEEFCSNFWKISFLYEYVDNDLKREIERRSKNNSYFTEGELWYILQCACDSLLYLKNRKASHGDVRPYTILISKEGFIKFSENFQFNKQLSGFQQVAMGIREEIYLSPEYYIQLKDKINDPTAGDPVKNEIFALGLSLLEAATLKSTAGIYDAESFTIKEQVLQSLLELVGQKYGQNFYQILAWLLEFDENTRATYEQLDEHFKLLKQESWWVNTVPDRIHLLTDDPQQVPVEDQKQPDFQNQSPPKPEPILQKVDNFEPTEVFAPEKYLQQSVSKSPQAVLKQTPSYSPAIKQSQQIVHQEFVPAPTYQSPVYSQPPIQTTTTNFHYDTFTQPIDYSDLDARINAVLAMSRETVMKYGGNKVLEEYERAHQQIPTTTYTAYEKFQPSTITENKTYITNTNYDIPSNYKIIEEKSYQSTYEPPTSYTTSYVKNADTGFQRLDDYTTYKISEQTSSANTGYTDTYKPSVVTTTTVNNTQTYGYNRPDYSIPQYVPANNDYQKISYQNVSESINLKRSSVGSKDYAPLVSGTTAQTINVNYQSPYTQNGTANLSQTSSTNNLESRKIIQTTTTQEVPIQYHQQTYTLQQSQQQQQQQLNSSRRESPYKPQVQYLTSEIPQQTQQQQVTEQVIRTTNNYQNYSDLDLDAEIQKSLKRSKEVELLVSSTRKTLAGQQSYQ